MGIRELTITCYDELARMKRVCPLPKRIAEMPQETAKELVLKLIEAYNSFYFVLLPESATIQSGLCLNYKWTKADAEEKCSRIKKWYTEFTAKEDRTEIESQLKTHKP
jgi:hypothetical protein